MPDGRYNSDNELCIASEGGRNLQELASLTSVTEALPRAIIVALSNAQSPSRVVHQAIQDPRHCQDTSHDSAGARQKCESDCLYSEWIVLSGEIS